VPGDNFGLSFSPDGTRFGYAAARSIVVEETGTRRVVLRLPMPNDMGVVGYMRWSPDSGTLFVSPLGGQPLGIDMASGAIRWRLDGAHVVSWSADGTMMADAWQGSLTLLDPTTGSPIRELKGFTGVGMAGFSADGQRLVRLRQSDGALEVIDLASASRIGRRIETGATLQSGWGALVVPADGKVAYVGSMITQLTAYDVDPASWAVKACAAAGRNLTRQEWAQYVGTLGDYRATCPQYDAP
jgi:hypothetical protein